ncbi:MAG: hypothetical protein ACR2P5_04480, partial [Gammaproteobacteria bacterium]
MLFCIFPFFFAAAAAGAFSFPDAFAVVAAFAAEAGLAAGVCRQTTPGKQIAAFLLYRAGIAAFFALPVDSHLPVVLDFSVKILALGICAIIATGAAALPFRFFSGHAAGLRLFFSAIFLDISLFFFFVPSFPALLFVPYASPYLTLGGVPLLIIAWH